MELQGLIPVIQCHYIEETLAFYQNALRYIIVNKTITEDGLQWVHLKSDNTYLMLQKSVDSVAQDSKAGNSSQYSLSTVNRSTCNIVLHYYTSDITTQHRFMTAKGINVGEIETTTYDIRQFYIKDPEGNTIAIGQSAQK